MSNWVTIIAGARLTEGGTTHRSFPTVINEGGSLINDILPELINDGMHNLLCAYMKNFFWIVEISGKM